MKQNPQYGNVGNLGDILKHAALINLLKLFANHSESGFAYVETHAFLLNAACPNPVLWHKEVNNELSLYPEYREYVNAEIEIMDNKPYRCSAGLAIDTLKKTGINNSYIILSEKNPDTISKLKKQLFNEKIECHRLLEDASYLHSIKLPDNIDVLFLLVDPFELDNILWENIGSVLKAMMKSGMKIVLELFTFNKKSTYVIWPSAPDGMQGPVSVLHRQPYHLAVYSTGDIRYDVSRCCSLLGWEKLEG